MKIISLMYHDIVAPGEFESSGFPGGAANLYKLEYALFDAHLTAIEHGRSVGRAVFDATDGGVLLTFDDGGASAGEIAGRLESRGWRGHFFVTTDYIGKPGFVSESDIKSLYERGHIVGSHSCSHPERLSACSRREIDREWRDSVARLENIIGAEVQTASVPGGFYSKAVADSAASTGIRFLFNSEPTVRVQSVGGCQIIGRFAMERMSAASAARLAAGDPVPRFKQAVLWQLKKLGKRLGGRYWLSARRFLLNRRG